MGIKPRNVGIRFIDSILDSGGVDKGDTLNLFSKKISERLQLGNEDYIRHNSFAGGYLQRDNDTLDFAAFACLTTLKQGDMNLLVNTSHFKYIKPHFLMNFAIAGFTHIELPDRVIPLPENHRQQPKRILRLFDFKGISEEDKARFYQLSEIVAASGDTSFSETISSALVGDNPPLPFFLGWHTGSGPVDLMLEELPYEILSHSELEHNPGNVYLERPSISSEEIKYMVILADGTRLKGVIKQNEPEFPTTYHTFLKHVPSESKILLEYLSKKTNQNLANFEVRDRELHMNLRTVYIECTESGLRCAFKAPGENINEIIPWDDLPSSFPRNTSAIFEDKNSYFPFIINALIKKNHLPHYKIFDMENKESIENYYKLAKYLKLSTEFSGEDIKFVRENRDAIASAWRSYCHYLNKTKNENNYFNQLMVTYTFHHLLKNNLIEQVINLAKMIKPDSLSEPLLHMAIRLNNLAAVAAILDANLGDINQPHPTNGFTPLHFAIHYNNSDIVKLLIERKADLTRLNLEDLSPLDFARKKGALSSAKELELAMQQALEVVEVVPEPELVITPPPQSLFKTKSLSNEERAIRNRVILECCKEIDRLEPESTRNPFSTLFFLSYDYSDTKINAYRTLIQTINAKPQMSIETILSDQHLKKLLGRKDGDLVNGMGVINRDKKTKEFYNVYDALTSRRFFTKSKSEDKLVELQDLVSSDHKGIKSDRSKPC